jgi:hypothetical protein
LAAPGLPIARVATGNPVGICTIERSESSPSRTEGMGTPMTGSVVSDATNPGSAAAPPAPAMKTRTPRAIASWTQRRARSGVRCADATVTS